MCKMFAKKMIYSIQIGGLERCTLEMYLSLIFVLGNCEILLSQYKYPDDRYMDKYFSGNQLWLFQGRT